MKIVVIAETHQGECRVALVPDIVAKLVASGFEVFVEADAGEQAGFTDDAYREVGVVVEADRKMLLSIADVVLSVQPPRVEDVAMLRDGSASISMLAPASQSSIVETLAERGVTAFSMVLLPRTSRAQSMDALSSQSSLAGYKAVLMAANRLDKFFPMLITAAGTLQGAISMACRSSMLTRRVMLSSPSGRCDQVSRVSITSCSTIIGRSCCLAMPGSR